MLNTQAVFERLDLGRSGLESIQKIRETIDASADPVAKSVELIKAIIGVDATFETLVRARLVAMAVGDEAHKAKHEIADPAEFFTKCEKRIDAFMADPVNSFLLVETARVTATEPVEMKSVEGVDTKVAVKANGKIKKGGKEVLALELYKKHVLEAKPAATNQEFIAVLMKQLQMSKAGATTYAYNCKKKLGEPEGGIVKAKKGRKGSKPQPTAIAGD